MAKKKNDYFALIVEQLEYTCKAAVMLREVLKRFDPATIESESYELHAIERQADLKAHDIQNLLSQEFITPIDREDIAELVQAIDSVTDSIDDILIRAHMYNIQALNPNAMRFANILVSSSEALMDTAKELGNFRKSKTIKDEIVRMNMYEEDGDRIYAEAMHELFCSKDENPLQVIAWMNLYESFEGACDNFEDVADLIERIIMKNI